MNDINHFCPYCGTKLPDKARFCAHCGYDLNDPATIKRLAIKQIKSATELMRRPMASTGTSRHVAIPRSRMATLLLAIVGRLPVPLRRLIMTIVARARDPEPETVPLHHHKVSPATTWGWLPVLTLIGTLGVFSIAYACTNARDGGKEAVFFFWLGLLLIFVPSVLRLLSPGASRFERIGLVWMVGLCLYLVNVSFSPLYFSSFDEFLHWRTANDIINNGHLFTLNVLLPVSPFYPGLEIVTDAFARLSGLSAFPAGLVVVGMARSVIILSLFMLYEFITKSARIAGIAVILYVANPHFLFFDAQFAYESLALPLATVVLFVMGRQETQHKARLWLTFTAWLILAAVVVTHHVTDFIFDSFLFLWTAIYVFQHLIRIHELKGRSELLLKGAHLQTPLLWTTLFAIAASLAWMHIPGNPVFDYLFLSFIQTFEQLGHLFHSSGGGGGRQLFVDYSGLVTPLWERLMSLGSVALITLCLPFALVCIWFRYRFNALASMFGFVALLYPFAQAIRLTNSGAEISDRASAFLFIPLACVLAIFIIQFWPIVRLNWKHTSLITCAIAVVFIGGIVLGNGPAEALLPGPYLVAADGRSIEPEGIQSALWTHTYLGSQNRISTDRVNRLLMSIYGDQHLVTPVDDKIDEGAIFFSPQLGSYELSVIRQARLRYLAVDLRLSQGLPYVGFYFDAGEPDAFQHTTPLNIHALTKFDSVPQINRVYDSGNIVIYDVGGLSNAP